MNSFLISEKIKTVLTDCGLSVYELSLRTGMSEQALELILKNERIPSLAALIKIARALGVRAGTFLDDMPHNAPIVLRQNQHMHAASFSSQLNTSNTHLDFYSLAGNKAGRSMEPFLITVHPTEQVETALSSHEGEEFIYVLKGTVQIQYGKETFVLNPGDSMYYDSVVHHLVKANGNTSSEILAVVYTPY